MRAFFAAKLREIRAVTEMTQAELAQQSGLSAQFIAALEAGEAEPSWHDVHLLAAALGADVTLFVDPDFQLPE